MINSYPIWIMDQALGTPRPDRIPRDAKAPLLRTISSVQRVPASSQIAKTDECLSHSCRFQASGPRLARCAAIGNGARDVVG
ncbi:hypothetical protein BDV06DRAFT_16191 [Aspergillus oleicola]